MLALLAIFVVGGIASGVLLFIAVLGLLGTCTYALAGEKVQDGAGGIAGGTSF